MATRTGLRNRGRGVAADRVMKDRASRTRSQTPRHVGRSKTRKTVKGRAQARARQRQRRCGTKSKWLGVGGDRRAVKECVLMLCFCVRVIDSLLRRPSRLAGPRTNPTRRMRANEREGG